MRTRPLPYAAVTLTFLALALSSLFALPSADSQKNPQFDYAIVTEMTLAGRALPAPSFDKPVYYVAHLPPSPSKEQRDNAAASGGTKPIPGSVIQKQLTAALASNGYRPADEQHPPTQALFIEWGACNKIELPGATPDNSDGNSGAGKAANASSRDALLARAKLIGGQKFAGEFAQALKTNDMQRFATRDDSTGALVYITFNDCFYLRVSSRDFEAHEKNQLKLLWITTISTPSQGISFERSLPIMINNAAYFFGRETSTP